MILFSLSFMTTEHVFVDSTHVKASADKRNLKRKSFLKKHQRLQATYLTKKSYGLYLIHVLAQKKDSSANRTMYTMNALIVTFALRESY
ncbi:hypothetical protein BFRIG_03112 [Peribacillus frigoritolerans]